MQKENTKCVMCGADISHKRSDAKTCNANCRKAYSRQASKINRQVERIKDMITSLHNMVVDDETEIAVTTAMVTLAEYLDAGYAKNEYEQRQADESESLQRFLESRKQAIRDSRRSHT